MAFGQTFLPVEATGDIERRCAPVRGLFNS
jgi:hypothetical protein